MPATVIIVRQCTDHFSLAPDLLAGSPLLGGLCLVRTSTNVCLLVADNVLLIGKECAYQSQNDKKSFLHLIATFVVVIIGFIFGASQIAKGK